MMADARAGAAGGPHPPAPLPAASGELRHTSNRGVDNASLLNDEGGRYPNGESTVGHPQHREHRHDEGESGDPEGPVLRDRPNRLAGPAGGRAGSTPTGSGE